MSDSLPPPFQKCTQCGAELPADGTNGLCPACLMAEAMKPSGPKTRWEPPTAEELAKLLPQYEITRVLGRGGMGAVYQGTQKSLDRAVAIKILSNDLETADASFAERFKNEARSMAKLSHPGIVAVYDSGETADGLLYIVMEFIEGTDVSKMIARQKRLHTDHAMAITAHVCDALAYAHERGIIHRDIKPANIMVGYDGVVKVADFGLAKMNAGSESAGLTQSGMTMGTLHYMAPEALMLGTAVDHRADIYAVGVMLYQMLTGKVPHGMFELPSMQVPGLDPRYDGIIDKAMREDRELRYQAAAELRHDLDAILTQPVVKVEPASDKAPAALETQARPQRPGGQANRPPQPQVVVRTEKKSSPLLWVGFIAMACIAAWLGLKKSGGESLPETGIAAGAPAAGSAPSVTTPPNAALGGASAPPSAASPAEATKEVPFTNTLGMKFVPVTITGGPTDGKKVLFNIWETRVQDYEVFVVQTKREWPAPDPSKSADHPVMNVRWQDAKAFANWLTTQERQVGKIAANAQYRLPSDHEWSCAASIGTTEDAALLPDDKSRKLPNSYPWGSSWPPPSRSGNYRSAELSSDADDSSKTDKGEKASAYQDGHATQAPVGSYAPNALGLYDLGGNLWEWCDDWVDASGQKKVLRGGGWDVMRRDLLASSYRHRSPPDNAGAYYGFRLVLEVTLSSESLKPAAKTPVQATKDQPFINTLGMKFVPAPDTKVLFCIHETRYKDYAAYAAEAANVAATWKNQSYDGYAITERSGDHPVTQVSWEDAQAFCVWLSKKEGKTYRLPTDEEWSIAVGLAVAEKRTKDTTPGMLSLKENTVFPWGGDLPPKTKDQAGNYSDESRKAKAPQRRGGYIEGYDDGFPTTAPVLTFKPNKLGLYDLGGNVWEWCEDWYDKEQKDRVLRGGAWDDAVRGRLLSSSRPRNRPDSRFAYIGFRCVLEVANQPALTTKAPGVPPAIPQPSPAAAEPAKTPPMEAAKPAEVILPKSTTPPAVATNVPPFTNSLGMKFVPVPDTKVLFCIHETRRQDFAAFATEAAGVVGSWKEASFQGVPVGDKYDHPVVKVSWEEAQAFCAWLSKKEGKAYRLPTDREWSIAVGIGDKERPSSGIPPETMSGRVPGEFPWGDSYPPKTEDKAGNFADTSFHEKFPSHPTIEGYTDGFPTTAPVMSFNANKHGLYDLGGNVWEWCEDWGNETQTLRVLRGGSWQYDIGGRLLSSHRNGRPPGDRYDVIGFRIVLEAFASDTVTHTPPAPLPIGPTTWTDTKGRTITATFKAVASGNVLLDIAGKVTPVPLNTLSAASQKLARDYQQQTQTMQGKIVAGDPAKATKNAFFVNTLGMKFVPAPDTKVLFCIHETRRQDYAAYAAESQGLDGSWKDQSGDGFTPSGNFEQHPVVRVSWEDAQKFCAWLSQKEGKTYRLPTDEEWSFAVGLSRVAPPADGSPAALQSSNAEFPWGGDFPPMSQSQDGNYSDLSRKMKAPNGAAEYIEDYDDGYPTTSPVMSFKPNKFGLYDMGGNVWEWCEEWYDLVKQNRVFRGGSWYDGGSAFLLSSYRDRRPPDNRSYNLGFRLVLELDSGALSEAKNKTPTASGTNVAVRATASVSSSSRGHPATSLNDGLASQDHTSQTSVPWWNIDSNNRGALQWAQYEWDAPQAVNESQVQWVDEAVRDGGVALPYFWRVLYRDESGAWLPVRADTPAAETGKWSTLQFPAVKTTALRLAVQCAMGKTAGVLEWKVLAADPSAVQSPIKALPDLFLGEVTPLQARVGWDIYHVGLPDRIGDYQGMQVRVNGQETNRFLWAHAPSRIEFAIPQGYTRFQAVACTTFLRLADSLDPGDWACQVQVDDKVVFESKRLNTYPNSEAVIDVAIPSGARRLTLITDPLGSTGNDTACWAHARLSAGAANAIPLLGNLSGIRPHVSFFPKVIRPIQAADLIGTWRATSDSGWKGTWSFQADGTVLESSENTKEGETSRWEIKKGAVFWPYRGGQVRMALSEDGRLFGCSHAGNGITGEKASLPSVPKE